MAHEKLIESYAQFALMKYGIQSSINASMLRKSRQVPLKRIVQGFQSIKYVKIWLGRKRQYNINWAAYNNENTNDCRV